MITSPFLQWICKAAGTLLAIVSLVLTVQFGLTISIGIAGALAVISIMASYMWPIAIEVNRHAGDGWTGTAMKAGAIVVALSVTMLDGITNSSTTGTHRVTDVHTASIQNTKAGNATSQLDTARATLAMQQQRLADLKKAQGWSASVTPVELKSRLDTADKAVAWEERRGGCGPKCIGLKQDRDKIAATLGAVTEHNKLSDMILATQTHIEKLGAQVAETPSTVSSVETQNKKLASLFSLDRNPGEGTVYWTDTWMMVAIGLIITLASQFFNMLAWLPTTGKRLEETVASKPANVSQIVLRETVSQPSTATTGEDIWQVIHQALNQPTRLAA
jgi:hypothetical protein